MVDVIIFSTAFKGLTSNTIAMHPFFALVVLMSQGRSAPQTVFLWLLHWLPEHFRLHFKILLLVFKYLSGLAPP